MIPATGVKESMRPAARTTGATGKEQNFLIWFKLSIETKVTVKRRMTQLRRTRVNVAPSK